jgi:hypothetical protein
MTTGHINLTGALQKVAYDLFGPPRGSVLTIEKQHDHWRVHDGVSFEKYQVSLRKKGTLGSFVRVRAFPGGQSTVDLAVKVEDGRIVAVEPIQPVVIRGVPFLAFPQLLLGLKEYQVSQYAAGLGRLFQSLVHLELARGGSVPELTRPQVEVLARWAKATRPPLEPGTTMPEFSVRDDTGRLVESAKLRSKPSLIVLGSILDDRTRSALEWMARYLSGKPDRFAVVEVMLNLSTSVAQYRSRGGVFSGTVVPDFEQEVYRVFRCTFTPAIYAFDAQGRFQKLVEPPLKSYESLAAQLDELR